MPRFTYPVLAFLSFVGGLIFLIRGVVLNGWSIWDISPLVFVLFGLAIANLSVILWPRPIGSYYDFEIKEKVTMASGHYHTAYFCAYLAAQFIIAGAGIWLGTL